VSRAISNGQLQRVPTFQTRPALIFRKVETYPFTLQMEAVGSTETGVSN